MKRFASVALSLLVLSCGAAQHAGPSDVVHVTGHVRFGARHEGRAGLSAEEDWTPARWTELRLVDETGHVLEASTTDGEGAFAFDAPSSATAIEVVAHVAHDGLDAGTTRDAGGRTLHTQNVPLHAGELDVALSDAETEMAGALHIASTLFRGLERVREWTGETLPSVYVYWGRGVTTEWSYYRGETPTGSNRFCLELLGGQPGEQWTTDTDEHDEAIQLHELGHFVMDRLSGDSSIGGMHPRGVLVDPGVAWEEGRATWFATAVLGLPFYRDTIGIAPSGSTRVDENLETPQPPRGLGSETSAASILWDLSDGGDELLDGDGDGVALGPAAVLRAMIAQGREPGSFASIGSFLRFLVRTNVVSAADVVTMLRITGEPEALLPLDDVSLWPVDVAIGSSARGRVDGITDPAPSGGAARPDNGFDAIRAFRVHVPARGMLDVQLTIDGSGSPTDHTDLDLELRDIRARVLDRTTGQSPRQAVVDLVDAGDYVIYVRDAGTGNRADFDVRVSFTTL